MRESERGCEMGVTMRMNMIACATTHHCEDSVEGLGRGVQSLANHPAVHLVTVT